MVRPEEDFDGLAVGRSHWPVLGGGARLHAVGRSPRVGEVVVYQVGSALRAHRVLARSSESLLVRGDNPTVPLERVPLGRVVGVWAPEGLRAGLGLGVVPGRAIGMLALAASRLAPRRQLRAMLELSPRASLEGLAIAVAAGEPERLAIVLGDLGLLRPLRSAAAVQAALLSGPGFAILARSGSRAVAGLRALLADGGLHLRMQVERRYRGQGLGRRLLDAAIAEARRRDAGRLVADIRRDNVASLRLFQGAGFTRIAEAVLVAPGDGVLFDRYALDLG